MAVLRNKTTGEITHVSIHYSNGLLNYVSKEDYDLFLSHHITEDEVADFFGECNYLTEIAGIANGEYPIENLKYDIMNYADLFNDDLISQ